MHIKVYLIFLTILFQTLQISAQKDLRLKGKNGISAIPLIEAGADIKNLMGVSVSDDGKVYVTQNFRSNEELSLLLSDYLLEKDITLTSTEDKKDWIINYFSKQIIKSQRLKDLNKDGQVNLEDLKSRKEKILILSDSNNNNLFDTARTFDEGFNDIIAGRAHSVNVINGDVYVTVIPHLWKLKDIDNDSVADRKEKLISGFGVHFGYGNHDLHSIIQGYDGKLYWSMGDRGLNATNKQGESVIEAYSGAILRCNPDGSELEVFAKGLRNCQYFDFDEYGNLFSIDHDADFQGEQERLVYLPEGSDSGWRFFYQYRTRGRIKSIAGDLYNPWLEENMWRPLHEGQGSHFLPPIENSWNAPSSFSFQPGMALDGKYKNHFLVGGKGEIIAFEMKPNGASFSRVSETKIVQGLQSQVLSSAFAPNGDLYFTLWASRNSALWALRSEDNRDNAQEIQNILSHDFNLIESTELIDFLKHDDRRVRQKAQFKLVERKELQRLKNFLKTPSHPQLARIHALWALDQLKFKDPETYKFLVKDPDPEIRAQTARVLGNLRYNPDNIVLELLKDESPRVLSLASITAAKLKLREALDRLIDIIDKDKSKNPVLRYICTQSLSKISTATELLNYRNHPNEIVKLSVVTALRYLKAYDELSAFLNDKTTTLRNEAAKAIYDTLDLDNINKSHKSLEKLAGELSLRQSNSFNIRSLAANRRIGKPSCFDRILSFVLAPECDPKMKIQGMDLLISWTEESVFDIVDGRHLPVRANTSIKLNDSQIANILFFAKGSSAKLKDKVLTICHLTNKEKTLNYINHSMVDKNVIDSEKSTLLKFLTKHDQALAITHASSLLFSNSADLRSTAVTVLSESSFDLQSYIEQTLQKSEDINELKNLILLVKHSKNPKKLTKQLAQNVISEKLPKEVHFEVLGLVRDINKKDSSFAKTLKLLTKNENSYLLHGGDAEEGRKTFLFKPEAMCSKCHSLNKSTMQVGPSLQDIARRHGPEYFLESILDPQAKITPGYGILTITKKSDEVISGTLLNESVKALQVKLPDGSKINLDKSEITKRSKVIGAMPALKSVLSKNEIRNLIAFLLTLK